MAFLTAEQFAGWVDHASREPFGFPIADLWAARQAAITGNAAGPKEPYTEADFLLGPSLADPPNEDGTPSEEGLIRKLKQLLPPKPKQPEGT